MVFFYDQFAYLHLVMAKTVIIHIVRAETVIIALLLLLITTPFFLGAPYLEISIGPLR